MVCSPPPRSVVPLLTELSVHSPDSFLLAGGGGSQVPEVSKMSPGAAQKNLGFGSVLRLQQTGEQADLSPPGERDLPLL